MQEIWVRSLGQEDPLEMEMTTHSSILAWEIPWEEESGRPESMGLQKSWTPLSNWTTIDVLLKTINPDSGDILR